MGSYNAMGVLITATRWSVRWDESTRSWNIEAFDDSTRCPSDGVYRVEWFGAGLWFDADGREVSP